MGGGRVGEGGGYTSLATTAASPQFTTEIYYSCSATATISYPVSLSKLPNGCQGHPRFCPSPPDRPPITEPDSNYVLTRCNFYSTIGMG